MLMKMRHVAACPSGEWLEKRTVSIGHKKCIGTRCSRGERMDLVRARLWQRRDALRNLYSL